MEEGLGGAVEDERGVKRARGKGLTLSDVRGGEEGSMWDVEWAIS